MTIKKSLLLPLLLLSAPVMAQPAADHFFSELLSLRTSNPAMFETALEFNRIRIIACGDVQMMSEYKGDPSFITLKDYFLKTNGVRGDGFKVAYTKAFEQQHYCDGYVIKPDPLQIVGFNVPKMKKFELEEVKRIFLNLREEAALHPDNQSNIYYYMIMEKQIKRYSRLRFSDNTAQIEQKIVSFINTMN